MSAVIIQAEPAGGVVMLTDGAEFDPRTGEVIGIAGKAAMLADVPCVLTCLGNSNLAPMIVHFHAGRWSSFDVMKSRIVDDVADTQRRITEGLDGWPVSGQLFFGGWSEGSGEFEAWRVACYADRENDSEPRLIAGQLFQPAPPDAALTAAGLMVDGELKISDIDDLVSVMGVMRLQLHAPYGIDVEPFHAVGGFVQVTALTGDGITSRIVKRWPDIIGQKINPEINPESETSS
jgi:hypothetical protein